ncbi:MAG: extracellular solute-binding protein [Ideonella sp.]|nr:extracellular solute-binding protein [Ideonella sp.]
MPDPSRPTCPPPPPAGTHGHAAPTRWARRPIHRRQLLGIAAASVWPATVHAQRTLKVLAWPGYADPDLVSDFERRAACRVELSVIDSDAALWSRLNRTSADGFDVFAVNTAELQRYIRAGLVTDIRTAAIPALATQLPRFRDRTRIPGLVHAGRPYAIPYTYSDMGLIYVRAAWPEPPDTILALWDPRRQGRVVAYDGGTHNFSLAAQALGLRSPFSLYDRAWAAAVERLISLRRNVGGFYTQPEESLALFRRRRATLMFANYGRQQLRMLRAAGLDVGYAIPREGALAWLDCWAITRTSAAADLATAWIDHLLGPAAGRALVERQGLASTTAEPAEQGRDDRLVWLEPVESEERRNRLWARIVSGDRMARVLAE